MLEKMHRGVPFPNDEGERYHLKRLSLRRGVQLFVQVILLWVSAVLSDSAIATPQIPDQILIGGEFRSLHSTPLESYLVKRGVFGKLHRKKRLAGKALYWGNTTNHRGYVATWQIPMTPCCFECQDQAEIWPKGNIQGEPTQRIWLFCGRQVVSGTLTIPDGELIESCTLVSGASMIAMKRFGLRKALLSMRPATTWRTPKPLFRRNQLVQSNMDARFSQAMAANCQCTPNPWSSHFWQRKGIALGSLFRHVSSCSIEVVEILSLGVEWYVQNGLNCVDNATQLTLCLSARFLSLHSFDKEAACNIGIRMRTACSTWKGCLCLPSIVGMTECYGDPLVKEICGLNFGKNTFLKVFSATQDFENLQLVGWAEMNQFIRIYTMTELMDVSMAESDCGTINIMKSNYGEVVSSEGELRPTLKVGTWISLFCSRITDSMLLHTHLCS